MPYYENYTPLNLFENMQKIIFNNYKSAADSGESMSIMSEKWDN